MKESFCEFVRKCDAQKKTAKQAVYPIKNVVFRIMHLVFLQSQSIVAKD